MSKNIYTIDSILITAGSVLLALTLLGGACAVPFTAVMAQAPFYEVQRPAQGGQPQTLLRGGDNVSLASLQQEYPDAIAITAVPQEVAQGRFVKTVAVTATFLLGALALLLAGFSVRRYERRLILIWEQLERHLELPSQELERAANLAPHELERALERVNRAAGARFVWDRRRDVVYDGRLQTNVLVVEQCPSCGAKVDLQVPLSLGVRPTCPFCGSAVSAETVNTLKLQMLAQLRSADALKPAARSGFSVPLFVVLVLIFWPLALVYALRSSAHQAPWARTAP